MGVPKTTDHIQINGLMQNPNQEPSASSKAPNEDLKDMYVLCTFKIKKESQKLDHEYIKEQWPYPNQVQDTDPSQEPPVSSKAPNQDMNVLCSTENYTDLTEL